MTKTFSNFFGEKNPTTRTSLLKEGREGEVEVNPPDAGNGFCKHDVSNLVRIFWKQLSSWSQRLESTSYFPVSITQLLSNVYCPLLTL